jgi:hypothetical protein
MFVYYQENVYLYSHSLNYLNESLKVKKSIVNIDYTAEIYKSTKLYYTDQWVTLNCHCAKLLIDLYDTKEGKNLLNI